MQKQNGYKHSKTRKVNLVISLLLMACSLLAGCYHKKTYNRGITANATEMTGEQQDSIKFTNTHHYTENFNFIVKSDSLILSKGQPEEYLSGLPSDTICLRKGERIAVSEIRMMPSDKVDTVWVELARDQNSFGWTRECNLLPNVVPDDPISQFISTFSDTHILISLIIISIISMAYTLRKLFKSNSKIVIFNDIPTFYPTLLTLIVSASATFYSSIQMFAPDTWHNFYFHPTLNPFSVTPILAIFLASVWTMAIVGVAVIDEVRRLLPFGEAILYLCSLLGVCAICYIVFSITTLYYIGYPLLAALYTYSIVRYTKRISKPYFCGKCGTRMKTKGKCPVCGAINE